MYPPYDHGLSRKWHLGSRWLVICAFPHSLNKSLCIVLDSFHVWLINGFDWYEWVIAFQEVVVTVFENFDWTMFCKTMSHMNKTLSPQLKCWRNFYIQVFTIFLSNVAMPTGSKANEKESNHFWLRKRMDHSFFENWFIFNFCSSICKYSCELLSKLAIGRVLPCERGVLFHAVTYRYIFSSCFPSKYLFLFQCG